MTKISDEQLLQALMDVDHEHFEAGMEPNIRVFQNVPKALNRLGIQFMMGAHSTPPDVERAFALNEMLFLENSTTSGGLHTGVFMYRDMFCRLTAPLGYGRAKFDFLKMTNLNALQQSWILNTEHEMLRLADQAMDILDFGYGCSEFGHARTLPDRSKDLIWRSHVQLESAAATAMYASDFRGSAQAALLGTELALKAGLVAHGVSESQLRSKALGHNVTALSELLATKELDFDLARVLNVISQFPNYVSSRYDGPSPTRIETGNIIMGAQYVASEVTRQFSDRNIRASNPHLGPRTYPA